MKKIPGDIIILHKCTKNHDHMLHCSWDMAHVRYNYFSFWAIFCSFTPLTAQKIKILKKWKKKTPGDIIILHMYTKNYNQMMCDSWDMVHNEWMNGQKKWHIEVGAPPKNSRKVFKKILSPKMFKSCIQIYLFLSLYATSNKIILKFMNWINNNRK